MEKYRIKEAIIVEGKYDLHKVKSLFEGIILATDGFGIYKKTDLLRHLDALSRERGILILTDGDAAGGRIRSLIKSRVSGKVLNAYIPDVYGKEKRKASPSAEGKLGVEGMKDEVILEAVRRAGATFLGEDAPLPPPGITRLDLYEDGFFGREDSAARRKELLALASLPERLNVSSLVEAINCFFGKEGYQSMRDQVQKKFEKI